ncbi:sensor histidine kinase [Butyrivibrio sp. YAB3001]|uniref:sensor histidine kinase n=1 Tax=Butyrivibrio sp. YAB3001 TaxID=1520812 RepID=UPI0008F643BF|nr:HAMP domain-containing sensor histidine kinase [Butyrivibrio sp. YAB3001]SFB68974.1 Histidine kinase-, DNA gyrase B-, and HSP90-like ATPase [Butyrivibrio sp. YAB3001]
MPDGNKFDKTHSIRFEISMAFMLTMVGTFGLCLIINLLFMENFYVQNKREAILEAYKSIDTAISSGDIASIEFDLELRRICERYDIEMIVLDGDSRTVKASTSNAELLAKILWENMINPSSGDFVIENRTVLDVGENYTLQMDEDRSTGRQYLEMWGIVGNGNLVLVRSTLESIKDNVTISNTFMTYVGIIAIVAGSIVILYISKRVTDPIKRLYYISDDMKKLNFEAKYEAQGTYHNEIDALGENMNELSETLETTIKELKNANIALKHDVDKKEQIDEMRKEFLSNVSHELKTPIALIQGYAEGLKEGVNDDEESKNFYCEVIMDEANKMNIMVKKLLTLNQLEFGNDSANMDRFDIVEMISNYIKSAELLAKQKDVTIKFDEYDPIFVWGDEFKIEEVLQNYYSNALNHIDGEKIVEIKLVKKINKVRVSVFNTGKPIPADSIGHIWEKFYKVDKARTREYGGSGVGLSIVKAIMESMHQDYGVINYDNGVEFYFELETK